MPRDPPDRQGYGDLLLARQPTAGVALVADGVDQADFQRLTPGIDTAIRQFAHPARLHVAAKCDFLDELIVHIHHQRPHHRAATVAELVELAWLIFQGAGGEAFRRNPEFAEQVGEFHALHQHADRTCDGRFAGVNARAATAAM